MILLDLSMPVMDGWEFLEEFIQLKPRIGKAIELYIVKPINYNKLEQIFSGMKRKPQ